MHKAFLFLYNRMALTHIKIWWRGLHIELCCITKTYCHRSRAVLGVAVACAHTHTRTHTHTHCSEAMHYGAWCVRCYAAELIAYCESGKFLSQATAARHGFYLFIYLPPHIEPEALGATTCVIVGTSTVAQTTPMARFNFTKWQKKTKRTVTSNPISDLKSWSIV